LIFETKRAFRVSKKNSLSKAYRFELLFLNESDIHLHLGLTLIWMTRGEQVKIPAPGTNKKVHLFGAWNFAHDHIGSQIHQKKTRYEFKKFLEELLVRRYPYQYLVLVLDNASYHHAQVIQQYLKPFKDRVFIFWLPTYAPELNLIERGWKHLKQVGLNNYFFETIEHLIPRRNPRA
jgi:transposase